MITSPDLYLGAFLITSGLALSLLNLRRLIKQANSTIPSVLISENILLMCIGIAFVSRSVHETKTLNSEMQDIEERIAEIDTNHEIDCNFVSVLKSYGPLIISLVNSFLTLIIDNYMHYRMIADVKKQDEENTVDDFQNESSKRSLSKLFTFLKKYFSFVAIGLQWIVPLLIALSMYPMQVKQSFIQMNHRSSSDFCMAMIDATNVTCSIDFVQQTNYSTELWKFIPVNYIEAHEHLLSNGSVHQKEINSVIDKIYKIVTEVQNETISSVNVTSAPIWRKGKSDQNCLKICYLDNHSLLLYMFIVAVLSYFIPITISTVILTKIHMMDVKRHSVKTYVSRELLYNILFWSPVMFDTFVSLLICSYSMNGMKTSMFNVIANVYQAVKNFMNTKYFHDNSVKPIG